MKKVLLATTILAASAGFAAADVTVTGSARMGVEYDGSKTDNELSFTNRVRIVFTASGETDGGLSFGATIRADNATGGNAGNAGSVFISGAFGKISMGDVDNAFAALFGDLSGVGLTGLGDTNELASSADGGAFGVPAANALGVTPAISYNGVLPTYDATLNTRSGTQAGVEAALGTLGFVWGPLFDSAAAADELFNPITGTVVPTATGVIYADIPGFDDMSEGNFAGALLVGLEQAPASALYAGLENGPGDTVLGNVFGQSYLSDAERDAFFAGGGTFFGPDATDDIVVDTNIAVNLKAIEARALYTYAIDGFGFALGASQTGDATAYSIGASYEAAGFKIAAEYARADWDNAVVASVTATGQIANTPGEDDNFNADGSAIMRSNTLSFTHGARAEDITLGASYTIDNLTLKAVAQRREFTLTTGANIDEHNTYGVSAAYKMDALGVSAFYKQTKSDALGTTADNYGIGASYDLGGGASIVGGIVSVGDFAGGNDTKADLGVSFTF